LAGAAAPVGTLVINLPKAAVCIHTAAGWWSVFSLSQLLMHNLGAVMHYALAAPAATMRSRQIVRTQFVSL
jgi:hypothetical protein